MRSTAFKLIACACLLGILIAAGCPRTTTGMSPPSPNVGPGVGVSPGTFTDCTWGNDNSIIGNANLRKHLRQQQALGLVWCDEPPNGFDEDGVPLPFKRQLPDGSWVVVGGNGSSHE